VLRVLLGSAPFLLLLVACSSGGGGGGALCDGGACAGMGGVGTGGFGAAGAFGGAAGAGGATGGDGGTAGQLAGGGGGIAGGASGGDSGTGASGGTTSGGGGTTSGGGGTTSGGGGTGGGACSSGGQSCSTSGQCCSGYVCNGGACCKSSGMACQGASDCCVGASCVNGTCVTVPPCAPSQIVISEVYGGGGSVTGSTYANDFVELHNRGSSAVNLSGWSLQYAAASGVNWSVAPLSGLIPAGGYYLVQLQGAGGGTGSQLPNPDATGGFALSQTSGKVALVESTTPLGSGCPIPSSNVSDFVGYGSANCSEGGAPAPSPSVTSSVARSAACSDSDVNGSDFASGTPVPENSASSATSCGCDG
jgi:Lamin Tail Domain